MCRAGGLQCALPPGSAVHHRSFVRPPGLFHNPATIDWLAKSGHTLLRRIYYGTVVPICHGSSSLPSLSLFHHIALSAWSPKIHLMCAVFVADWLLLHPRHVFQQLRTFLRQLPNSGLLVCDKALLHFRLSACRLCIYLVAPGSGTAANSQIFLRCCHSS